MVDAPGTRYGIATIVADAGRDHRGLRVVLIDCECGTKSARAILKYLRCGDKTSCGCVLRSTRRTCQRTHGARSNGRITPEYGVWQSMKDRCFNPNNQDYDRYGGRGITVCERWKGSYANFLADVGPRPRGHSIDRIDVNGNYEPGNCRWATQSEQMRNTRRTRHLTLHGKTQSLRAWATEVGIAYDTIRDRLNSGWSVERSLTVPVVVPHRRSTGAA